MARRFPLPAYILWFLFLLVLPHQPARGADVTLSEQWSLALQDRITDIDKRTILSEQVIATLNGFQSLNPPDRETPASEWVDLLAGQVADLMKSRATAVENLAVQVEQLHSQKERSGNDNTRWYNSIDRSTWDSTFTSTLAFDPRYNTNVSFRYSTIRAPDYGSTEGTTDITWSQPLDTVFRSNLNSQPALTNQYFASADGYLRTFPGGPWVVKPQPNTPSAAQSADGGLPIQGFNARFSQWYVLAASGPKDVVLVLDSSNSMGNLYEVRKAAWLVVSGLTPQDYVNVVTFNANAVVASCWQNILVRATDENKQILKAYLMDLEIANGRTDVENGLRAATQLLNKSLSLNQTSHCERILLLLTDGITSANHFDIDNDVEASLFAYVLTLYTDTSPLQRLTCANSGILVPVPNPAVAYTTMASYYTILAPGRTNGTQIWVGPLLNQYTGTGLVLSVVRPCYDRSSSPPTLIGVVGVDLPLDVIDVLVKNFLAPPSYSFVVNDVGTALIHPLAPNGAVATVIPPTIDIAEMEDLTGNEDFRVVRDQLVRGIPGNMTIPKVVRQLRGYFHFEGYVHWNATANYYYRHLFSDFSIAVVWVSMNKSELPPINVSGRTPVTHVVPDAYHSAHEGLNGELRTSFSVAAKGYCDPVWFTSVKEDDAFADLVVSAVGQPSNSSCPANLLTPEARSAIKSTSHIERVWNDSFVSLQEEVRVRFIATHYSGVMRTFPGKNFDTKFDPTYISWYRRAVAHTGELVASVPHMRSDPRDVLSAFDDPTTNTILLTRTVPYAIPSNVDTTFSPFNPVKRQTTYGVVGISIEYQYFSDLFLDVFQQNCTYEKLNIGQPGVRCFLIDASGYVLTHPLFLLTLPRQNESYIFVGRDEPLLTQTLIRDRVLVPVVSNDYHLGSKRIITTYSVQDSTLTSAPNNSRVNYKTGELLASEDCLMSGTYFMSKISSSNMYLVVLNVTRSTSCAYTQTSVIITPVKPDLCAIEIATATTTLPKPCFARSVTNREMESLRGIQKCRSETSAVILGLLIPLAVGAAILGITWLLRRHRRMRSMREGMLVANADSDERNEHADNAPDPNLNPEPNIPPNPNPNGPNLIPNSPNSNPNPNIPYSPHLHHSIAVNDLPIDDYNPTRVLLTNMNNPSFVVDPQLHHANPNVPPNAEPPANASRSSRSSRSSLHNASPRNRPASMRSTASLPAVSAESSLRGSGNAFFSPFFAEAEDVDDARSIPMLPLSTSVSRSNQMGGEDTSDDDDDDNDDEDDDDDEGDEDEEDEESEEGSDGSVDSERDRDPDDLFAGMAREMGIVLPRTSASGR